MTVTLPPAPAVETPTVDQVDDYHGDKVSDSYRWLEDTYAPETERWVAAQNARTEAWLARFPCREEIRRRLRQMFDYTRYDVPFERGGRYFQTRNTGLQDQSPLYVMDSPTGEGRLLLDPNELSPDGTVALASFSVTDDGSLLAYATSSAGSDWMTWRVREVASGRDLPDLVEWAKFGAAAWLHDGSGFFYESAERPREGEEYLAATRAPRVMFHRLGTSASDDQTVFESPEEPEWLPWASVTEDGRWCVVSISRGTNPESRLLVRELAAGGTGEGDWSVLVEGFSCKARVVTNVGSTFYLLTDLGADRQRIVAVDLEDPDPQRWRDVVPEREALLLGARNCGGRLVCHFLEHATSRLEVLEIDGTPVAEVPLPPQSALLEDFEAPPVSGSASSSTAYYKVGSFTDSGSLWSYDVRAGAAVQLRAGGAPLDESAVCTEQVFITASDGAAIPVFLVRRRDLEASGEVPVLLYGYGGFDIPITPSFDHDFAVWIERGGLLAVANLRGGGEYGRAWHDAGRLASKQRVFDDFCDVARWLGGESGWSRPGRIAINGRSNGGLLVGACLTQHPELFGAAVPEVGVLDMLRYHLFTIGWAWKSDFGDPEDPEQYRWLRAYSPLHQVRAGQAYPPTLVMTGDHDDRVVPGHSFKFFATLAAAQAGTGPILIRVETSAGHGHGKPVSKVIAERADLLTFVEAALGLATARPDP
ncbi:MAG TPA: prolyl oligopeptidase family serine peptidase [Acidimicrobiales bacterium]|nr:prolyl oligopeptidase family serine peptidase [Acidimicrobiales bacterium]